MIKDYWEQHQGYDTRGNDIGIIEDNIKDMTQGAMIKDYWEQHQGYDTRGNDIGIIEDNIKDMTQGVMIKDYWRNCGAIGVSLRRKGEIF